MLAINTKKAFKLSIAILFSYFLSIGIVDLINFQYQTDSSITSELLDSLYLILNSLFFVLTLLLIKLFYDEKE
ncbi:MAG: hypothetical protein ACNI28_06825 [Arcobacter sp.]|uniref:hypothetical protein n=1 Tax=Arcobacter sp. TaxID=1872629 RepID=UPI003AFF6765